VQTATIGTQTQPLPRELLYAMDAIMNEQNLIGLQQSENYLITSNFSFAPNKKYKIVNPFPIPYDETVQQQVGS
jgi:hypothetical protein